MRLILLLLVLLLSPSHAESTELRFATLPPDCKVACPSAQTLDNGPGWIRVEVPQGVQQVDFHLFKEGYESYAVTVPASRLTPNEVVHWPPARDRFLQLRPISVKAVFHTRPAGAKIWTPRPDGHDNYLGKTGEEVYLNLATLVSQKREGVFLVKITAPGYENVEIPIPEYSFGVGKTNRWPAEGSYSLSPTSGSLAIIRSWTERSPALTIVALLLVFAFVVSANRYWRGVSILLEKARKLEQLSVGTAAPVHLIGARIGQYRLLATLGTGGTSTVYRACRENDLGKHEDLAIKVLSRAETESRLVREVVPLLKLNHPSLVALYDWGVQDGFPYIVMEYVAGRTLRQELQSGPLALPRWTDIAESVISGVIHAHDCGVVHGDIKPENIILPWHGRAKLADFGLASLTCSAQTHRFSGTPGYIAPETLKSRELSPLSDQYSLAVVLYETHSGGPPPRHPNPEERDDPLHAVLWKMLSEEPTDRYSSLLTARDAIREALKTRGVSNDEPAL